MHYLDGYSTAIRHIMDSFPQTKQVFEINGLSLGGGGYNGMIAGMKLHDWSKRTRSQMQLMQPVQAKLNGLTSVRAAAFEKPSLPGSPTGFPVQFVLTTSGGYASIERWRTISSPRRSEAETSRSSPRTCATTIRRCW